MWEDIRIGDRVRPKKGGPVMVVEAHDGKGCLYCYWTEHDKPQKKAFDPQDLEVVERPRHDDPTLRMNTV